MPDKNNLNAKFHCPVPGCIYHLPNTRYFSSQKYLKQHYMKVHAEKVFCCPTCEKRYSIKSLYDHHLLECGNKHTCSCGKYYNAREALLTHAKRLQHTLPPGEQLKQRKKKLIKNKSSHTGCQKCEIVSPPPIIIFVNSPATLPAVPSYEASSSLKPKFILPKPAPYHTLPAPTLAAVALSELSMYQVSRSTVATQTLQKTYNNNNTQMVLEISDNVVQPKVSKRVPHSRQVQKVERNVMTNISVHPGAFRATATVHGLKRQRKSTQTQTAGGSHRSKRQKTSAETQTCKDILLRNSQVTTIPALKFKKRCVKQSAETLDASCQTWELSNGKCSVCQPNRCMDEFNIRNSCLCVKSNVMSDPLIGTDIRRQCMSSQTEWGQQSEILFGLMSGEDEFGLPDLLSSSERDGTHLLSCETQTDINFDLQLLMGDVTLSHSDSVLLSHTQTQTMDDSVLLNHTQTQTMEDNDDIPYEQLLTSMETQTSEEFLLWELGIPGLRDAWPDFPPPAVVNTETQTVHGKLDMAVTHSTTQTNTSFLQDLMT